MRKWIRSTLYLSITTFVCVAFAGVYEDFFVAVKRDDGRAVSALLERGFDPNTRDPQRDVALILALKGEALAVAEALMSQPQTQVDLVNAFGESALMMAALRGQLAWCQRLLERGAPVNQAGWSPLHYAATGSEPAIVQLLLDRGAIVDADSPNRSTPLMMAARYGKEESIRLLLARGADPKRSNDVGMTAADFASSGGREALARELSKRSR